MVSPEVQQPAGELSPSARMVEEIRAARLAQAQRPPEEVIIQGMTELSDDPGNIPRVDTD